MPRLLLAALPITVAFMFAAGQGTIPRGRYVSPAQPFAVTDVPFPTAGPVNYKAISLLATVGTDGRVSATKVVDFAGIEWSPSGSYEDPIVKDWKFSPALDVSTLKTIPSVASVTFLYTWMVYPPPSYEASFTVKPVVPNNTDYVPPLPLKLYRADYPALIISGGAVVLVLQVGTEGWVSDVHVIRSVPSLDEPSVEAAKLWTFLPARYLGKPVRSTATVALVYLPFIIRR